MNLEKSSLRSLSRHMELIARAFFDFQKEERENTGLLDIDQYDSKHRQNEFVRKVEEAYEELNPIEQLFINNDFFGEEYSDWWRDMFTYAKYTSYKKRAIIHFLRVFYDDED